MEWGGGVENVGFLNSEGAKGTSAYKVNCELMCSILAIAEH